MKGEHNKSPQLCFGVTPELKLGRRLFIRDSEPIVRAKY